MSQDTMFRYILIQPKNKSMELNTKEIDDNTKEKTTITKKNNNDALQIHQDMQRMTIHCDRSNLLNILETKLLLSISIKARLPAQNLAGEILLDTGSLADEPS